MQVGYSARGPCRHKISERKMLDCLTRLGSSVQIVIGPATTEGPGRFELVFA